ncbi:restriction endonuclease [Chloroflexales bacterium ZM16-3]|nr:restriction endonuclease [Chloroflexales bacterium ZM16-3]
MSIARHHAEWLALLDISGPFLSLKTLVAAFPQGLDAPDAEVARELRMAYEEWLDSAFGTRPDPALHRAWVEWVIRRVLGMPDDCVRVQGIGDRVQGNDADAWWQRLAVTVPEHGETLTPDIVMAEPAPTPDSRLLTPRILVQIVPPGQDLEKAPARAAWQASPATRMMTLLRGAGVRLGLLTNGEQWMLVDRPADENLTTGFASWYARLWLDEPLTLRAFRSLLGAHRIFGVPDDSTLEALLAASADDRQEVTDQLGYQVRRAVELLVQAIDLADQNAGRAVLTEVREERLYEAALAVMMRLVFLLFAEEQGLLLLGDDLYDRNYAVSTLLESLRLDADRSGEEVLERRHDAWGRLLAIFRAVYYGFDHDKLDMPAYGGSLFDPDRYPFLEGRVDSTPEPDSSRKAAKAQRKGGTTEAATDIQTGTAGVDAGSIQDETHLSGFAALRETPVLLREPRPLLISNRVVLHLLEALQVLRVKLRDGSPAEARRISFRALDIEQIGHVYEGLLDHTALRATEPVLGIAGTRDQEPEIPLARLEEIARKAAKPQREGAIDNVATFDAPSGLFGLSGFAALRENPDLLTFLREQTGRSESALKKALAAQPDAFRASQLRAACGNDESLYARVLPFAGLVRDDDYARPVVIPAGSVYVTAGAERRATGTHYTPRSLTEPIVQHTLEPLVYVGPAEGLPKEQWRLRPAAELLQLTVCDMAMGSGAFLVQACRYLSERLLEAFDAEIEPDSARKAAKPQSENGIDNVAAKEAPSGLPGLSGFAALREPARLPDLGVLAPLREITDPTERLVFARRLIADRCLYGVDKNPLAVEMAKLSLWLITLARGRPFSFLDHALRAGDSLLGIGDVEQLMNWSLKPDGSRKAAKPQSRDSNRSDLSVLAPLRETSVQYSLIRPQVERALAVALRERRKIAATPVREARDAALKAGWLSTADAALALVRLGADLLIAAELHPDKGVRESLRRDWLARYSLLLSAAEDTRADRFTAGGQTDAASQAAFAELRAEADRYLDGRRPFHWPLEFPEVFVEPDNGSRKAAEPQSRDSNSSDLGVLAPLREVLPGFAAIVGNPPFQGGQRITGALGTAYRDYLVEYLADGRRGSADLCAYFFLRIGGALRPAGMAGLLATNTIAQGDTREVGLDHLAQAGFAIPRAVPSRPWPGTAGVEVAHIWLRYGSWRGEHTLDEKPAAGITPFLTAPGAASGNPFQLNKNAGKSFQGSNVLGLGFTISPNEAEALIAKDPRNREAIFPYLNGEDLNSRPDQSPSRWVINFHDWPLEKAESYLDLMAIVREKVKPERDKNNDKRRREIWWQFTRPAPELYATIAGMERVLAVTLVSRTVAFALLPTRQVYAHRLAIFPFDSFAVLALLQSNFHHPWAWQYSSTMKSDLNYAPANCFETFPFPACLQAEPSTQSHQDAKAPSDQKDSAPLPLSAFALKLDTIGEQYHAHRQQIMRERNEGLTKTYNRFHAPGETAADIAELRRLHVEMDAAVAAAYGWQDLDLGHGFHETKQGLRYTISEAARRAVLDRLLALNHARHAEEVAAGLHEKGGSRKGAKPQKGRGKQKRGEDTGGDSSVEQGELF